MAILLSVRDWDLHFERNRTRELKVMAWIPLPVKLDGDGYTELLDHANGAAHFGAWVAILEVAARCEIRGTLLRGDRNGGQRPHDPASLSRLTRIPAPVFEEAIPRLVEIGWLLSAPYCGDGATMSHGGAVIPHQGATIPQVDATQPKLLISNDPAPRCDNPAPIPRPPAASSARAREEKRREEERREEKTLLGPRPETARAAPPADSLLVFPCVKGKRSDDTEWGLSREQLSEWLASYPAMDVLAECRKALTWVNAKPERRKTYGGMPAFLVGWLNKGQNRGDYAKRNGNGPEASPPPPQPQRLTLDRIKSRADYEVSEAVRLGKLDREAMGVVLDRVTAAPDAGAVQQAMMDFNLPRIAEVRP